MNDEIISKHIETIVSLGEVHKQRKEKQEFCSFITPIRNKKRFEQCIERLERSTSTAELVYFNIQEFTDPDIEYVYFQLLIDQGEGGQIPVLMVDDFNNVITTYRHSIATIMYLLILCDYVEGESISSLDHLLLKEINRASVH